MKVEDFEKTIEALDTDFIFDEVVIKKGEVKRFYAHRGITLVLWDSLGKCYSIALKTAFPDEIIHSTHNEIDDWQYKRDTRYDLRFK